MTSFKSVVTAVFVHCLTASGAVMGLLALWSASQEDFEVAFAWLVLAMVVDAVDGPLARYCDITNVLPRFSGERLDHIVDYLNYVMVPAFLVLKAPLVPAGFEIIAAGLIALTALYHFADTHSKTRDGYFIGFPAIWNIVVFYIFAVPLGPWVALVLIVICIALTFSAVKWLHWLRVARFRIVSMLLLTAVAFATIATLYQGFPAPFWAKIIFIAAGLYALIVGGLRTSVTPVG